MTLSSESKEPSSLEKRRAYDADRKAKQQQHKQLSSPRQGTPPPLVTTSSSTEMVRHWLERRSAASSRITAAFRGTRARKHFTSSRKAAQLQRHEPHRHARDDGGCQDDPMAGEPETAADRPESAIEVTLDVKEVWFDAQEELETDKPEVSAPGEPVGAAQAEAESPPCADPLAESPAKSPHTSSFGEMVSQGVKMVSQALGADTTDSEAARDAQAQAQARCELVHQKARLDRAAAELAARERALKEREEAVGRREAHVEIRVKQAAEKVQALVPQQAALREWEARVKRAAEQRERDMVGQETALMEWHRDIERRTAEVGVREQQSEAREGEVVRREEQAETREALVAQREVEAAHQHQMVARRAADVEADAAAKADDVTTRALEVQAKSNELEDTKLRLEERHLKLEDDTKALEAARRELSNSAAAAAAAAAAATGGGGALVATGGADVAAAAAPPVVSWPCLMPKLGCVGYHVQQGTTAAAFQKVIDDIGEFANLPAERFVPATVAAGVAPTDGRPTAPLHSYPLVILFIKVAGSRLSEGVIHADEVARCRAVVAPGGRLLLATINAGHNAGVAKELPADCPRREMIDGLLHFSYVSGCPPKRPHGLSRTSKLTETAMHELGALLPAPPPKYAMTVATAPAAPRPPRAREDSYNCLFPWLNSSSRPTPRRPNTSTKAVDPSPRPSQEAALRPSASRLSVPVAQPITQQPSASLRGGGMLSCGESGGYGGDRFVQNFGSF